MEFDKTVEKLIISIVLNTSVVKEHVTEIKQIIFTEKKRTRCVVSILTFKSVCLSVGPASKIPKLIHFRVVLLHTPNSGLIDL